MSSLSSFSRTREVCSSCNVRDQVSHPFKKAGKIMVLYILIFMFLNSGLKQKILDWMVTGNLKFNLTAIYQMYYFQDSFETYNGPNPLELLAPLFTQLSCSYKVSCCLTDGKYVTTGDLTYLLSAVHFWHIEFTFFLSRFFSSTISHRSASWPESVL